MSHPGQDPILHWIHEATATMGVAANPEGNPGTQHIAQAGGSAALKPCLPTAEEPDFQDYPTAKDPSADNQPKEPGASSHGTTRHEELQEMRHVARCRGFVPMGGIREGDEVVLEMGTNPIERQVATCRVYGVVEGTVAHPDESGGAPGIVLTIKGEEDRTNGELFLNDPIPPGSRVVLYGTALPSNDHMRPDDRGRIVRNQTPVITAEGERVRQLTASPRRPDGRQLELKQVTVNDVPMFEEREQ